MCYLITDIDESHLFDYLDNLFSDTEDKGATALLIIKCMLTTNVLFSPTVDRTSSGVEDTRKRKGGVPSNRSVKGKQHLKALSQVGLGSEVPDSASSDECLRDDLGNYS